MLIEIKGMHVLPLKKFQKSSTFIRRLKCMGGGDFIMTDIGNALHQASTDLSNA
jgi:hypothetical protein